jgi:hypothetical protein
MATPCLFCITVIDAPVSTCGRFPKIYLPVYCCDGNDDMYMVNSEITRKQYEYVNDCWGCVPYLHSTPSAYTSHQKQQQQHYGRRCNRNHGTFLRIIDLPQNIASIFKNFDYNNFNELWQRMSTHGELHMIEIIHRIQKCCVTFEQLYHLLNI